MAYKLLIKDSKLFYLIGYFDPAMKDKPAQQAFRTVKGCSKQEVTFLGAEAIAREIGYNSKEYWY